MSLTIGQLAAAGAVGVETVRFYQRRGLLDTPARNGGIRRYDDTDVRRLRFIRTAQKVGFTLEEIGELLGLDAERDRPRVQQLARQRIERLDAQIAELQRARHGLARLATQCAQRTTPRACPILAAFDA